MTARERRPLEAPGAGLPPWERALLHAGLALSAILRSRRWASARIGAETGRLLDLLGALPEARAACAGAAMPARGIADMKPNPAAGPDTVDRFRAGGLEYLRRVNALPSLRSRGRVARPWFGPIDAHSWHVLAARHHSIHRRHAARIVAALP